MHFMDDDRFVNLGEDVILTLLWQCDSSESTTVWFVISLSICYSLFKCGVLRVVCACVCERGREREREKSQRSVMCVCVCVNSRLWERETRSYNRGLCANTYEFYHFVSHVTLFPSRAWTDGKTKDIINCRYFDFDYGITIMERGVTFLTQLVVFGHSNKLCQLANQRRLCLSEGGTLKKTKRLREARHRGRLFFEY